MKIKYMGPSDVRTLAKGEDFGGQLATPLDRDIVWDWDNKHVIDTDDFGLSEGVAELILEQPDFKDVTDLDRIPVNEAQKLWKQMRGTEEAPGKVETKKSGTAETDTDTAAGGGVSEAADVTGAGTTTTGGSTRTGGRART